MWPPGSLPSLSLLPSLFSAESHFVLAIVGKEEGGKEGKEKQLTGRKSGRRGRNEEEVEGGVRSGLNSLFPSFPSSTSPPPSLLPTRLPTDNGMAPSWGKHTRTTNPQKGGKGKGWGWWVGSGILFFTSFLYIFFLESFVEMRRDRNLLTYLCNSWLLNCTSTALLE